MHGIKSINREKYKVPLIDLELHSLAVTMDNRAQV